MTSESNVEDKVKEVIEEQLGVPPEKIMPESNLQNDLGADSLDAVELIMALEEKFDLEIPDEEAEKLSTVSQIIEYIEQKKS